MVWSDQSSFPFYVIDNNGNIILTINETGLHLHGTNGDLDAIVSGGVPEIRLWNPAHTQTAFFNFPVIGTDYTFGINGENYTSVNLPGLPTQLKGRIWFLKDYISISNVTDDASQKIIGGYNQITSINNLSGYNDSNGIGQGARLVNNGSGLYLIGVLNGTDGCSVRIEVTGCTFRSSTSGVPDLVWDNSLGFFRVANLYWTALPLFNGWTTVPGYSLPEVMVTSDGRTMFKGNIRNGNSADGTQIANLPATNPWGPAQGLQVKLRPTTEGGGAADGRIIVNGIGQIFIFGMAGTTQIGLDGLSFWMDY